MACLTLLSNSKEAGDPGVRRKGVAEEVSEVTELANGSIPSRCVHLRVYLPVHRQGSRVPGALCPSLCVARCAPFGLGTWKSLTALVYLSTSQVSGSVSRDRPPLSAPPPLAHGSALRVRTRPGVYRGASGTGRGRGGGAARTAASDAPGCPLAVQLKPIQQVHGEALQ